MRRQTVSGRLSSLLPIRFDNSGSEAVEAVCSDGLSALGRTAVVLFPDPRQAVAVAEAAAVASGSSSPPTPPAAAAAAASTPFSAPAPIASHKGAVLLQLAVVLPQDRFDTVQDRSQRRAAVTGAGRNRGQGVPKGGGSEEVSAALVARAAASGRVTRVVAHPPAGGGGDRDSSSSSTTLDGQGSSVTQVRTGMSACVFSSYRQSCRPAAKDARVGKKTCSSNSPQARGDSG